MVDLSFLEKFTKGKRYKFERYIRMYLELAPESYQEMEIGLSERDHQKVANQAHGLRPQATFMGIVGLDEVLLSIETDAKARVDWERLEPQLIRARQLHEAAIPSLEAALE